MPPALDLRRLRYFQAVAEHGSFAAAGRALFVAQPVLSHHMAELEKALGVLLMERSWHGARVTEAGEALLGHARTILRQVAQAECSLRSFDASGKSASMRVLHLGIIPSLGAGLTPLLLAAINRDFPGMALHIIEVSTRDSHAMIESGQIDLAINLTTERRPGVEPLIWEDLVYITAAGSGSAVPEPIRFIDLACEKLVLPSIGKPVRELMEDVAKSRDVTLDVVLEIDGLNPRIHATIAGIGSTVLAPINVADDCAAGRLVAREIVDPPITRQIVLERRQGFDPVLACLLRDLLINLLQTILPPAIHRS